MSQRLHPKRRKNTTKSKKRQSQRQKHRPQQKGFTWKSEAFGPSAGFQPIRGRDLGRWGTSRDGEPPSQRELVGASNHSAQTGCKPLEYLNKDTKRIDVHRIHPSKELMHATEGIEYIYIYKDSQVRANLCPPTRFHRLSRVTRGVPSKA